MAFAVISWNKKGSTLLPGEEMEALSTKKIVVEGEMAKGSACSMQYNQEMWYGKVHSLHDKKKSAIDVLNALFNTPERTELPKSRKRTATAKALEFKENSNPGSVDSESDENEVMADNHLALKENTPKAKKAKVQKKMSAKKATKKKASSETSGSLISRISCENLARDILAPLPNTVNYSNGGNVSSEESDIPDDDELLELPQPSSASCATPQVTVPEVVPRHPKVGNKTPKSSFPPTKCINVHCKEEKMALKETIAQLKQQIEELKSSSSPTTSARRGVVKTPNGPMDAEEASQKGLSEIAQGVWCCPVKVKSLINSVTTRTSLACGLLAIFCPKEELSGRRLGELDQCIVKAIADFAVVAKLPGEQTKDGSCTRAYIMQALRTKCNALIFARKRPTYHKEKYENKKILKKEAEKPTAGPSAPNHIVGPVV